MKIPKPLPVLLLGLVLFGCIPSTSQAPFSQTSPTQDPLNRPSLVQVQDGAWVNEQGEPLLLRGVNLGNWLLLEMWMFGIFDIPDQATFFRILDQRFGEKRRTALIELHRENWIKPKDYEVIKETDMNVVRLPLHYSLFEKDGEPEAFRWIDETIEHSKANGLYVILDLHGAPGGQSVDQPTGEIGRNLLWEREEYWQETLRIWKVLSQRYKHEPVIAAYDLLNEPYGTGIHQNLEADLVRLCKEVISVIREQGDRHVLLVPGSLKGARFYPDSFWEEYDQIALTEHFYPGVYDDVPSLGHHLRFITENLPSRMKYMDTFKIPFLVGEYNVVLRAAGGDDVMRHYIDLYDRLGWAHTMWAYKSLHPDGGVPADNWQLVSNQEPLRVPDPRTASYEEMESFFRRIGEMEWEIDQTLAATYTDETYDFQLDIPKPEDVVNILFATSSNVNVPLPEWPLDNVGGSTPPATGYPLREEGLFVLESGGHDIYKGEDSFEWYNQSAPAEFSLSVDLHDFDGPTPYSKAGLMIRQNASANSPLVFLHVFPNGNVVIAQRKKPGAIITESKIGRVNYPVRFRLTREEDIVLLSYRNVSESEWSSVKEIRFPFSDQQQLGFAVLSRDTYRFAKATFSQLLLEDPHATTP